MFDIAISRGRLTSTRVSTGMLLVGIGLVAGLGLAHMGTIVATRPTAASTVSASPVSVDNAYRVHAASERALAAPPVTATQAFQLHTASERALVAPRIIADDAYRLHWASERGLTTP